ncbi:MAG: alpha/beta hydrolase [Gammaproteobacteria bacterium]|nr:alpha/beta hydrolase [Gammaproteobacteria bacterium]
MTEDRHEHRKHFAALALALACAHGHADMMDRVEHRHAENEGVRIHYVVAGSGPLVVMVHGFPDFWYSWCEQITALESTYRLAAVDLRGYNGSDKPKGVENYAMPLLVADIAAVIAAEGEESAVVAGHDWGGAIAWSLAMSRPELVSALVILNLPHPAGLRRELATNPDQRQSSAYAYAFQEPDAHRALTAEGLAGWVTDESARARYVEAFEASDFEAMLNYYKANFPSTTRAAETVAFPKVQCPVLMFHGLDDQALLPGALNGTWEWVERDLTLVTIPGAGHFVQQDASEMVSRTMRDWLARQVP